MTNTNTHDTAVKVDVYADEFRPVLKLLNLALMNKDVLECMSNAEVHKVYGFKDDFATLALEYTE
jgi:hypothetical protein